MKFKKIVRVSLLAIVIVFCSSCSKENSESNNSNLPESANTMNSTEKEDYTQEAKDDTLEAEEDTNEAKDDDKTAEADSKTSTVDLTDSELQQILDNNEFLTSFQGTKYQISSYHFAKAFLNGDYDYITDNLIDKNNLDEWDYKDRFSKIECMFFRLHKYNKEDQTVYGEYAIQLAKDDGYIYLEFNMRLIEDKWKIISYGLDT